ncbi:MAG: 1-deoxy-D-xylulose-5-phosphate reductoisomerase [Fidelibacterota bacterium]
MSKRLTILGSTGSIGLNTLKVFEQFREEFQLTGLSAHRNYPLLIAQAKQYLPKTVVIGDPKAETVVKKELIGLGIEVLSGRDGLLNLAARRDNDIMLNGLVGAAGMEPTLCAIQAGVDVALSNKESLVMAGQLIEREKEKSNARIFPVDSEHSAIWQCLIGESIEDVNRIILTGSGGPFRQRAIDTFNQISPEEALQHPNWDMGDKITIDSATMMNKGLEVIETYWLFGLTSEKIDIVIHPQSVIHSMVEFKDKSVKAQLGIPDMKIPIQYALTYPRHRAANWEQLDLVAVQALTFEAPDLERFPCIKLAYEALHNGGTTPAVLNVANEQAVYRFLKGELKFTDIPRVIEEACGRHHWIEKPELKDLLDLERWTKEFVTSFGKNYLNSE